MVRPTKYDRQNHPVIILLRKKGPLTSSQLLYELVDKYSFTEDAASKQLVRLYAKGWIYRHELRLKAGAYFYYLSEHSRLNIQSVLLKNLATDRPRLFRLLGIIEQNKLISLYDICRLANVPFSTPNKKVDPRFIKIVNGLVILGIKLKKIHQSYFLVSPNVSDDRYLEEYANAIFDACIAEANLLYLAIESFIKQLKANKLKLYRDSTPDSIANKFDVFGEGGWKKKATLVLECNLRRQVLPEDITSFSSRIASTAKKHKHILPMIGYYIGSTFSPEAKCLANEKSIRSITDKEIADIPSFIMVNPKLRYTGYSGKLKDLKGRVFEYAVEKVMKKKGYRTELRKIFYMDNDRITDDEMNHNGLKLPIYTDIDVFCWKRYYVSGNMNSSNSILLVMCKSMVKQLNKKELKDLINKLQRIASFLKESKKVFSIDSLIIVKMNKRLKTEIEQHQWKALKHIRIQSPSEFYNDNLNDLKGEQKWLFGIEQQPRALPMIERLAQS